MNNSSPSTGKFKLRTVFAHQISLLSGAGAQRACSALIVMLLCRALSAEAFGRYVFMMSLLDIAFVLIGFGSHTVIVRAVAQGKDARALCDASFKFRLVTTAAVAPLLLAAVFIMGRDSLFSLAAIMAVGLVAHVFAEIPLSVLQGRMFMGVKAAIDAATGLAGVVLTAAALASGFGLIGAAWAFSARRVLTLAAAQVWGRLKTGAGLSLRPAGRYPGLARESAPFGAAALAVVLYIRWSPILLFALISEKAAGLFGGALQVFEVITLVGTVMARAAFPSLAAAWGADRASGESLAGRIAGVSLAVAAPLAFIVSLIAPWAVPLVFKNHFADSAPVLRVLLAAAPMIFVYEILIHGLYAAHRQKTVLAVVGCGVFSSLALNAALLPRFGLAGAAFAVLLNETSLFSAYAAIIGFKIAPRVALGAMLASAGLLLAALSPHAPWQTAAGGAACCAASALGLIRAGRKSA